MTSFAFAKVPATKPVNDSITFEDDLNFENMIKAIDRHLVYFKNNKYMNVKFKLGDKSYKRSDLKNSMVEFKKLVNKALACQEILKKTVCETNFSNSINLKFSIFKPIPNKDEVGHELKKSRFTAYYSPSLKGSKTKSDIYKYAIYAKPKQTKYQSYTREQIQYEGKLLNKGLELFYVSDSMLDLWLLHVEGGGIIEEILEDGSKKLHYLSYNGTNKKKFTMLSTYMLAQNMITSSDRSLRAQRAYIQENPSKEREIISSSKSYVYFKTTKTEPLGVRNIPLTMNRSMASDKNLFNEYGFISYIKVSSDGTIRKKEDGTTNVATPEELIES
jgi:membrane-bound lytic murein transglycosylase